MKHVIVKLARHEWGVELMNRIAQSVIEDLGAGVVVEVWEHGGWWLCYTWLEGHTVVVGSANDQAAWSPRVKAFWDRANSEEWEYLPEINREAVAA